MDMSVDVARTVFQASLLASGLARVEDLLDGLKAAGGEDAADEALSTVLIRRGVLTEYQSAQLMMGRTKFSLGPYLITDWIGQGGMGQVFKAVHRVMGRICAVKVLPLGKATEESRNSFIREIRLQAGLDCAYLVRAYDAGQDGNVHYLVTEYVPGTDLRKLVKNNGRLNQQQSSSIIMQAALGLDYAHRQGLIHRDVKPGNLLVTPEGHVKVSDVGLAAWSTSITEDPRAGKVVGTADYLSPEQIRTPLSVTTVSDIYSLGCTLYYCVCGKVPYPGGDSPSKCRRHCEETPWHPRKFAPELSEDFVDIIAEMMDKDPARRIATASEVATRLEPYCSEASAWFPTLAGGPWTAPPPPAEEPLLPAPPMEFDVQQTTGGSASAAASPAPALPTNNALEVRRDRAAVLDAPTSGTPLTTPAGALPQLAPTSSNSTMAIAIALAIAIPISLLVGAIVGFWVHTLVQNP